VAAGAEVPDLALPEEGIMVTGSHVLPHWTQPSEGVPSSLLDPDREAGGDPDAAWNALGSGGARWRNEHDDWDDPDAGGGFFADEDDQGPRLGVLDTDRSDRSDLYSFDEAFQQLEEERSGAHPVISLDDPDIPPQPEPVAVGARARARARVGKGPAPAGVGRARAATTDRAQGATGRGATAARTGTGVGAARSSGQDLGSRVLVGAGLVVLLVVAYAVGPKALVVLTAVVVLFCAAEAYGILQRCGFRPATLLGLTATGGLVFASYWRGEPAVPLVLALAFTATMIWYILGIVEARPLANVAVTSMTIVWVGVLGSFAALMLRVPHGKGLFLGAVVVTVASDIVAYFAGRQFGHRPLAPSISPGKTIEGFVAGALAAVVVGIIIGKEITPWGGIKHGLLLGLVVAIFAPIGDLFESLIKRDLEVKDSGTALAGHGGLLDRFDSLLLVLPAVYYLADYLHLVR
jgi:phosphatidate cytidylyltransferase